MNLCSFPCPFSSLLIPVSSVQVCISIQSFSLPLNSKSTCESFSSFSFIQTLHLWVTDVQRSAFVSLQGASAKALSCAWFWYSGTGLVVQTDSPNRSQAFRQHPFLFSISCFLVLLPCWWLLRISQSLSATSYWVYLSQVYRVFLSHMFACV